MSAKRPSATQAQTAAPDLTPRWLTELAAMWPQLEAALDRDGVGLSATGSGAGGGKKPAAPSSLVDMDTAQARISIEGGVHRVEAEVIAALQVTPAPAVLARLRYELARCEQARMLCDERRAEAKAVLAPLRELEPDQLRAEQRRDAEQAIEVILAGNADARTLAADAEILRGRVERVEYRSSTPGVLEALKDWYLQLRPKGHRELADRVRGDVERWRDLARDALGLQTPERPIGWQCPHHRDEPAELIRDRDQATLAPAVVAGARPRKQPPLEWQRARSVYCPRCKTRWKGAEQLRALMRMIERVVEEEAYMVKVIAAALDDEHLAVVLYRCGTCRQVSSRDAWAEAWLTKFGDADVDHVVTGVCPRCEVETRTDELEQLAGVAVLRPEPTP